MTTVKMKKTHKALPKEPDADKKTPDKIWCPEGEHYQYVEVCKTSCKKMAVCEAYGDYREPRLI